MKNTIYIKEDFRIIVIEHSENNYFCMVEENDYDIFDSTKNRLWENELYIEVREAKKLTSKMQVYGFIEEMKAKYINA